MVFVKTLSLIEVHMQMPNDFLLLPELLRIFSLSFVFSNLTMLCPCFWVCVCVCLYLLFSEFLTSVVRCLLLVLGHSHLLFLQIFLLSCSIFCLLLEFQLCVCENIWYFLIALGCFVLFGSVFFNLCILVWAISFDLSSSSTIPWLCWSYRWAHWRHLSFLYYFFLPAFPLDSFL